MANDEQTKQLKKNTGSKFTLVVVINNVLPSMNERGCRTHATWLWHRFSTATMWPYWNAYEHELRSLKCFWFCRISFFSLLSKRPAANAAQARSGPFQKNNTSKEYLELHDLV